MLSRPTEHSVSHETAKAARTLVFVVLAGISLRAQPQRPFYAADPLDSPRIAALKKAVESGDRAATVAAFWEEVRKAGTPLVEPAPGDGYSWVTFLWQAKENTVNVAIIDGVGSRSWRT